MKHTKGEWKLFKGSPTEGAMPNGMTFGVWYKSEHSYEEAKANAKLIATAPELLEALQKIVHLDDELCKCPACKIGKPIIKKATQ